MTNEIVELPRKVAEVTFCAIPSLVRDLKLSRVQFLGCHGQGNRFANGQAVIKPQYESDLQLENGNVW
jgi:hypothetical protein